MKNLIKFKKNFITLVLSIFISSCNSEDVVISKESLNQVEGQTNLKASSDNNLTSILDEKLNLIKADYSSVNLSTLKSISTIDSNYEISEYSFKGSNNKIIIAKSLLFPTRNVVLKGFSTNINGILHFEIVKELVVLSNIDENGEGSIEVTNLTEGTHFKTMLNKGLATQSQGLVKKQEDPNFVNESKVKLLKIVIYVKLMVFGVVLHCLWFQSIF
jgi:hypothetical protein